MTLCSGTNKTTGKPCQSKPENRWGTCRRHLPAPPTAAEFAAALEIIKDIQLPPVPSMENRAYLTKEELEQRIAQADASVISYPEIKEHSRMYHLSLHLGIRNEFTDLIMSILTRNISLDYVSCELKKDLEDKEFWDSAIEAPLADTVEGLEAQRQACDSLYSEIESADMGAGYQFWQIKAFEKITARNKAIDEKIAALKAQ